MTADALNECEAAILDGAIDLLKLAAAALRGKHEDSALAIQIDEFLSSISDDQEEDGFFS